MKKSIVKLMLLGCLVGLMTGCGSANTEDKKVSESNEQMKKIGIVQIVEHPSLDTIRESTIKALEDKGLVDGENIKINYQSAQGDQSNLNSICKKFVSDKVDVIIAIATPSAQAAAAATKDIPIIFSAVTDPLAAKVVDNIEKPTGNITGTSDAIPVDKVFELCKELTPDVKKLGFLYTASEVNSQSVIENAKKVVKDYGLDYEEVTITNVSELQQAAESLAKKVDAIYTPIDNNIASAMPALSKIARDKKIPLYVGADSLVKDGGYATVGINYEKLGMQTAEMVYKVLNGTPISEIPVETLNNFEKMINKTTAEKIGAKAEADGAIIVE